MNPLHPRLTLFPYTTLFRSSRPVDVASGPDTPSKANRYKPPSAVAKRILATVPGYQHGGPSGKISVATRSKHSPPGNVYRDRKSTRLNSSHVRISYAVFCLK